jgi:hypothetical protein
MLYGHNVVESQEPIDNFLNYIDRRYLDFDLRNEKCKMALEKFYVKFPNNEQLATDIRKSAQCEELKNKLLTMIVNSPDSEHWIRVIMDREEHYYNPKNGVMRRTKDGAIIPARNCIRWDVSFCCLSS